MKIYINQPSGLGDILFCQKIASVIKENTNDKIIWPIVEQYSYLPEYLGNDNNFISNLELSQKISGMFSSGISTIEQFVDENKEPCKYIPLTNCHVYRGNMSVMEYKYEYMKMKYTNWEKYFHIKRNYERENILVKHLNINSGDKFNIVNTTFGTYPAYAKYNKPLKINNDYKNIEMKFLGFDRIFDWIPLLESAQEIHTVNTSIVYLIEKIHTIGNLYMYSRNNANMDMWYSSKMYKSEWKYIPYD